MGWYLYEGVSVHPCEYIISQVVLNVKCLWQTFWKENGNPNQLGSPSSNTQEVQLWSSRLSPSLMTLVSYHRFVVLSSVCVKVFEKVFGEVWEKMIAAASCVCAYMRVYVRVCMCAPTDTHRHICTGTHRHTSSGVLLTRSQKVVEGRGATGAGWWSIGLRMTPLFRPSFWPSILTLKIDRSRWRFERGAKRRTKANEVSLKNRRHKNY